MQAKIIFILAFTQFFVLGTFQNYDFLSQNLEIDEDFSINQNYLQYQNCSNCYAGSSGPCQNPTNKVCYAIGSNNQCWPGTQLCHGGTPNGSNVTTNGVFGAYFPNWAQYRVSPYTFNNQHLSGIANSLTHLYYGFVAFCPTPDQPSPYWAAADCQGKAPFELTFLEPKDEQFITSIRSTYPKVKLIASIGGWNFPSSFFSEAVSTSSNRASFISQIRLFVQKYKLDGIDIDWEYPCSQKRTNPVKITCQNFKHVQDNGGNCASQQFEHGVCSGSCPDADNMADFFTELRAADAQMHLSVAATANTFAINKYGAAIAKIDQAINSWNLMTYDYYVSDISDISAAKTAANQNYNSIPGLQADWSVKDTIKAYKANGATAKKMILGVALYGHSWYVPGQPGTSWQKFGLEAQIQGQCCQSFAQTYGAKYGPGAQLCGSLMYSEMQQQGGFEKFYDEATMSTIGYNRGSGTWLNFLDKQAIQAQVQAGLAEGLGGAFTFDVSQDSIENGQFTYELHHVIQQELAK